MILEVAAEEEQAAAEVEGWEAQNGRCSHLSEVSHEAASRGRG